MHRYGAQFPVPPKHADNEIDLWKAAARNDADRLPLRREQFRMIDVLIAGILVFSLYARI